MLGRIIYFVNPVGSKSNPPYLLRDFFTDLSEQSVEVGMPVEMVRARAR